MRRSIELDPAAGKHEFARHEFVAVMAAAEQHLRDCAAAVDQQHGGGIADFDARQVLLGVADAQEFGEARGRIRIHGPSPCH